MAGKHLISYNNDYLDSQLTNAHSCVVLEHHKYHMAFLPYHLNNISESIKEILNIAVGKYDKKLGGILLSYRNIKLLSKYAPIINDSCFIHLNVEADFYLFKPKVGCTLVGVVNKVSNDHVGCLVHNFFNASILKPRDDDEYGWIDQSVKVDTSVLLKITLVDLESRLLYIRGEFLCVLDSEDRDSDVIMEQLQDTDSENEKQKVNRKKSKNLNEKSDSPSKKRKRKEKVQDDSSTNIDLSSEEEVKFNKKLKRDNSSFEYSQKFDSCNSTEEYLNAIIKEEVKSPNEKKHRKKHSKDIEDLRISMLTNILGNSINSSANSAAKKKKEKNSSNASSNANDLSEIGNGSLRSKDESESMNEILKEKEGKSKKKSSVDQNNECIGLKIKKEIDSEGKKVSLKNKKEKKFNDSLKSVLNHVLDDKGSSGEETKTPKKSRRKPISVDSEDCDTMEEKPNLQTLEKKKKDKKSRLSMSLLDDPIKSGLSKISDDTDFREEKTKAPKKSRRKSISVDTLNCDSMEEKLNLETSAKKEKDVGKSRPTLSLVDDGIKSVLNKVSGDKSFSEEMTKTSKKSRRKSISLDTLDCNKTEEKPNPEFSEKRKKDNKSTMVNLKDSVLDKVMQETSEAKMLSRFMKNADVDSASDIITPLQQKKLKAKRDSESETEHKPIWEVPPDPELEAIFKKPLKRHDMSMESDPYRDSSESSSPSKSKKSKKRKRDSDSNVQNDSSDDFLVKSPWDSKRLCKGL